MYKMILSVMVALSFTSSVWAHEPRKSGAVYAVYPLRSCLHSVGGFVCDTTKVVVGGTVTVLEGTWGIITAPLHVKWKKPRARYLFYQPPRVHYEAGKIYEVMPPDLVIELE